MAKLKHAFKERGDDFYSTPIEAVQALLREEWSLMPKRLWEPACGDGAIVQPLREWGQIVRATDLVERGCPESEARVDFLMTPAAYDAELGIVTNPPYKLANEFVAASLERAGYTAMLLRLNFLASQRRVGLLKRLKRVYVFSRRLPMMHRDGWEGSKATSQTDYAWFVWDDKSNADAAAQVHWLDWRVA